MNKIFKVIFNKTTGKLVVVSELTKSQGKAASSTDERVGVSSLVTKLQHQAKAALVLGLLGVSSTAMGAAVTQGTGASADGKGVAIGDQFVHRDRTTKKTEAKGEAAVAIGAGATANTGKQGVAIGQLAIAGGSQSVALGGDTKASAYASIAIGGDDADTTDYARLAYDTNEGRVKDTGSDTYQATTASGVASIAIGTKSQATQKGAVGLGVLASATGSESIALGAKSAAKGANSSAVGAGTTASGADSVAAGYGATASAANTVAVGKGAQATGADSTATGTNAQATGANSTVAGTNARATGTNTVAIGSGAASLANNAITMGYGATTTKDSANAIAIGTLAASTKNSDFAIGNKARATGGDSVAMGTLSRAAAKGGYASGIAARAAGKQSVALGWMASTGTGENTYDPFTGNTYQDGKGLAHVSSTAGKTGDYSIAIGNFMAVTGSNSIGIGKAGNDSSNNFRTTANVSGDNSIAIGASNNVTTNNTIALGNNITTTADNSIAIGDSSKVTVDGGIALGAGSEATTKANAVGYDITGVSNTGKTWVSTDSAVSVGSATKTRQITNVAAGTNDTDAVNVAQLKKAKVEVVAGRNVTVDTDTKSGYTKYTINATAEKTVVSGINGVKVTEKTITGGKEYVAELDDATREKIDNLDPTALNAVKDKVNNQGITFTGNSGTTTKKLGEILEIVGTHIGTAVSSKNIKTEVNTAGKLEIKMSENPDFKTITVTPDTGAATTINGDGVQVGGPTGPKLAATGLDNGGKKITNVAAGSDDKDAVNYSQLNELKKTLGLAIGPDGKLTQEASNLRNQDGSNLTSPDMVSTVRNTVEVVNRGVVYGGELPDDYKELTDGTNPQKQQLGSKLSVIATTTDLTGTSGAKVGKKFAGDNLITKYVRDAQGNGAISVGFAEKPVFEEVNAVDPNDPTKSTTLSPSGTTVKDGSKETTYGVDGLSIKGADGQTTTLGRDADGNLTVTNGKDGKNGQPATAKALATKEDVNKVTDALGLPKNADGTIADLGIPAVKGSDSKNTDGTTKAPTTILDAVKDAATAINKGISLSGNDYDATKDATVINKKLGERFEVVGTLAADVDASSKNIRTTVNTGGKLEILMAEKPEFKELTIKDPANADDKAGTVIGKDGISVKGKDGADAISLTNKTENGETKPSLEFADNKGAVKGLEDRKSTDPAVTDYGTGANANRAATEGAVKSLADKLGITNDNTPEASTGAAGKDGLDGKTFAQKIDGLRDGTAGNTVYTDENGKRVVKANDGKYYKPEDVNADGSVKAATPAPVPVENVMISNVNTDGSTVAPIKTGNIASGLGLDSTATGNVAPVTEQAAKDALNGKDGKPGLLAQTGNSLNNAVTVKDLQALAQAGLDFTGDNNDVTVHRTLGSKLTVEGEGSWDGSNSASENLYVQADSANNKLVVKMNKELKNLKSVEASDTVKVGSGDNQVAINAGTSADPATGTTAKPAEIKFAKDGAVNGLADRSGVGNQTDPQGAPTADYGTGENRNRAATEGAVKDLADKLGVSNDPEQSVATTPAGKDGLDGKNFNEKIDALRNGEAGPIVYTNQAGDRLVQGEDGKYYNPADLADKVYDKDSGKYYPKAADGTADKTGTAAEPEKNPIASAVNPDGTTTNPTTMGNLKSSVGLDGKDGKAIDAATAQAAINGKDGQPGLLAKSGPELNNAATVGDLQALAQAGLDFTGNNNTETVHRPLGTKLTVVGERDDNKTSYTADESAKNNLIVEADATNNKLTVKMANELKNLKSIEASESIKVGTDENGVKITPTETTTTKTEGTGTDKKVTTATAGADGTSIVQKDANDQPLKSADYKLDGTTVKTKDKDGNDLTTTVKADGVTATDKDSKNTVNADGMTVGPKDDTQTDKSAATYGRDGMTVKGNDGKDAIALTSTTDADGKTTNALTLEGKDGKDAVSITSGADGKAPAISFAKDGEGTDAKGTGSITGLKDVERNLDGTAKDRTAAANAGYVDDRLKEMNEGKPFEYFDKDGNQVVRGKDGKFYDPKALEGKVYDPTTKQYYPAKADGTADTAQAPVATGKPASDVVIKAMPNEAGPVAMGNVGSGLGLDAYNGKPGADGKTVPAKYDATKPEDVKAAQSAADKLYALDGDKLNNVVTAGDLQALAVAGLDFTGNNNTQTTLHRTLGSKLVVEGETDKTDVTKATFGPTAKDNIHVEAKEVADGDKKINKLVVSLSEDLKGINSLTTKPVDNGDGTQTTTKLTPKGTEVAKVQPAVVDPVTGQETTPAKELETANYGLNTELKKTDADGKVTTSTSAPTGTTLSEADKNGNKLREAEYDLDGTKVTSKDPATGITKETTTGVDGTNVTLQDANNPNNDKSAKYGVDGTELKAKDAQGNPVSADYKVGGATVKDKDNTTEIKPDGMTVKSTDEADKSEAKYGKDGLSIVGPKGEDGKDGISLGYKPDTNADGQPVTGADGKQTSTPTLEFGKGADGKGTGAITGLKDVERNPNGSAVDKTAAASTGYVDERLAEADAGKPFEYFDDKGNKVVRGQDGKFYDPKVLEGKVYVEGKGYVNRADKDNPDAKPVDLKANEVNPQTVTIKAMPSDASNTPIAMSNVGSGLGLKDDAESNKTALTPADAQKAIAGDNKDGKGGLLAQTGNALNNVATVKDLQALAQAGLDFTGNNTDKTVHRPLGTKLTVEGEGKWDGKDSAANNLYVEANETDNKLVVKMNKDLTNLNSVTLGTATMTGKENTINLTGAGDKVEEEFVKWDPKTKQPIRDENGKIQKYKEKVDPRVKLSGIADGDISPNSTDAVNGRQVYALTNGNTVVQKDDGSTVTYAIDPKTNKPIQEVVRDKDGNPVIDKATGQPKTQDKEYKLTTYNVSGQQEFVTNSVITAVHNMNEQGIKFFHTNDGVVEQVDQAKNSIDSSASGAYATAVGYQSTASGDNAVAMGKGATASGVNSIAIGTGNQVIANKSGAFGDPNIIKGTNSEVKVENGVQTVTNAVTGSYAIGNDNYITTSNTFVLGNDVNNSGNDTDGNPVAIDETVENSVYLGNKTTATKGNKVGTKNLKQDGTAGTTTTAGSTGTVSTATVGNMTYGGFAGATADGVVSVGAAGNERRIQNVAAGEISATSTDAINGSQLYSVAAEVDNKFTVLNQKVDANNAAINMKVDNHVAALNEQQRQLNDKVDRENKKLRSGVAAVTAMSNIPQVTQAGKSAVGAGLGSYDGQNAVAVGYSRMSDNGRMILKVTAGATTQGKYNMGAGMAFQW